MRGWGAAVDHTRVKMREKLTKVWPIEIPTKQISNGSVCEIRCKPVIEIKQTWQCSNSLQL